MKFSTPRLIELESALIDDCSVNDIFAICQGKTIPEALRPDVWQVCLDVRHKPDQLSQFNEIYDLPFQNKLRQDCHDFVENLGNEDEDKVSVISDLESILTFYCKSRNFEYESTNGWIQLLLPLLSLKLPRSETYNLFERIRDSYIPKGCCENGNVFHIFRLLILYHDPELCTILDTKRITPETYSLNWFQSLFATTCTFPVVLSMWDLYFQQCDPFLVFYLSLIMLINGRDQILNMKNESKENIIKFLMNMPCALEANDVVDFCSLAQYYSIKTPASFKTDLLQILFGKTVAQPSNSNNLNPIAQALCLPVSAYELIEDSVDNVQEDSVRFFVVDCRPADQYNAGHLPTAFHLDCNLMLQEPLAFQTAVQGLLRAQQHAIEANSNAGGEHLCFLGSGRVDEDQYAHMVIAYFLQKNTQYVSFLTGGYYSIHEYFGEQMIDCLEEHDPIKCLVCSKDNHNNNKMNAINNLPRLSKSSKNVSNNAASTSSDSSSTRTSGDFLSKFSAVMKSKSAEVKDKLIDYMNNPNGQPTAAAKVNNQVKPYQDSGSVFSIDDDENDETGVESSTIPESVKNQPKIVKIQQSLNSPDVIKYFKCHEVHMNGYMYESYLLVTNSHLIVLRESNNKGHGEVISKRLLSSIVKITAKKRHRDLITFKYGVPEDGTLYISDMDRFLIPNASEATQIISNHILKQL